MQRFQIIHEFDGEADRFWELFFRDDFTRAFHAAVDIELEVEKDVRDEIRIERIVRYRSTKPVTAIVRPFLPDGLGYTEHATFDRKSQALAHRIVPTTFADRTEIVGEMRVTPAGPNRIRRSYTGSVSIRVPVMGPRLEAGIVASMTETNDVAAKVTARWLAPGAAA